MPAIVNYRIRGHRRRYQVTAEQIHQTSVGYGRATAEAVAAYHPAPSWRDIVIETVGWKARERGTS